MSTTSLPGLSPSAAPPGANSAASTCGVSGTIVMITSAASATCLQLAQALAPWSSSACGSGARSCRNSVWPPVMRWPAIGRPIVPTPISPTFMVLLPCWRSSGARRSFGRGPGGLGLEAHLARQIDDLLELGDLVDLGAHRDVGDPLQ